ncbi:nucleotide exchange factor SIL1 [Ambystoma mexicanum]|uniref:nucleotide exchange factor SIL1 n=1 Tax=Ambystoma mexicanum TaxID=8296 RepID=UPI0037E7397C
MAFRVLLLCAVLFCVASSHDSPERAFALSTTEGSRAEEDLTGEAVVEDELDPEDQQVFHPTHEWQVVRPGQAVPAGLHVRLNLQSGINEARLPDTEATAQKRVKQEHRLGLDPSLYTPQGLKRALAKLKEDMNADAPEEKTRKEDLKQRFRPIEELKQEFERLHMNIESDFQIMARLIKILNSSTSTVEQKSAALYDLEYYVHQVDNAQDLLPLGGLQLVVNGLNSTEPLLRERSAFVLGSALSSNPRVQVKAMEGGALQKLLVILATEQPLPVKKKALFALSSMLRQFPYAQQQFLRLGGLDVLKGLSRERGAQTLSVRVVTLLYDLMVEKQILLDDGKYNELGSEKIQQYSQVDLAEAIQDQGWCTLISDLLGVPDHDHREKVLQTLNVLLSTCREPFRTNGQLNTTLDILRKEYEDLVKEEKNDGDDDGYFKELHNLVIDFTEGLR